jgi:hypothetical protein
MRRLVKAQDGDSSQQRGKTRKKPFSRENSLSVHNRYRDGDCNKA